MKEKILRVLRQAENDFVSGQKICGELGVSRQAIWKNINQLRGMGYEIESVTNRGYRLVGAPDRIIQVEIESRLSKDCFCKKVECHDQIGSTNTRAKQLAEEDEPEGILVVADEQVAGKGRRGRGWISEPGVGIWMSLLVRPKLSPQRASGITLVAALAVAKAISQTCQIQAQIKWPNDIIIQGKKVCGILTETSSEPDYIHYAVIGIGINANTRVFPAELADHVSSIAMESGHLVNRQMLIVAVMEAFTGYYATFLETGDLSGLTEEYNALLVNRDRQVKVYHGLVEEVLEEQVCSGVAKGIDPEGALLVEMEKGVERVVSGEVSVRGMEGYI